MVDDFTRECLAAFAHTSISGTRVARAGCTVRPTRRPDDGRQRQRPGADLACDPSVDQPQRSWLELHHAGQPQQNALVESFIGRLRDELLSEEIFENLADGQTSARALATRLQPGPATFSPSQPALAAARLLPASARPGLADGPAERAARTEP